MDARFSRTALLVGQEAIDRLAACKVAVFGLGGVGGYAAEALARSGVGSLYIVDSDTVAPSNINRQLLAGDSTIGQLKTELMKKRILDINPKAEVVTDNRFYLPANSASIDFHQFDYVIDAIDTVTAKIDIIHKASDAGTPIISAMGCGNRLDPELLEVTDLFSTADDPLARTMRRELRRLNITCLTVVCSREKPITPSPENYRPEDYRASGRPVPGSSPFVPPAAGYLLASRVVRDLIKAR